MSATTTISAPASNWLTRARAFLQQSTTGQGAATIIGAVTAYSTGTITLDMLYAALAGGVFLILFPQANTTQVAAVQAVASDIETIGKAFMAGHKSGVTLGQAAVAAMPTVAPLVTDYSALITAFKENATANAAATAPVTTIKSAI
jgi:hypothetical protein